MKPKYFHLDLCLSPAKGMCDIMKEDILLKDILSEYGIDKMENAQTNDELKDSNYYKIIADTMKRIHSNIPVQKLDEKRIATDINIRELYFQGKVEKCAVIYLMSNGCEWALKSANGCTMCGHIAKQTRSDNRISSQNLITQFNGAFNNIDFKKNPILYLYNNGSFLNDNEIDTESRRYILSKISENDDIKMLVIETRPEFVERVKIKEIKEIIPKKYIEIAMGLEMKNDTLRTICINKGFSLNTYTKAVKIINEFLNTRTYVLLKPPFLSERESIESAIETIKYAFAVGCKTVSLEACTIQDYTLVHYLYTNGLYKTPWLWSILEVLKNTYHLGKIIIGLFTFYPSPTGVPYNCDNCSDDFMNALIKYNQTLDIKAFDNIKSCKCMDEWKRVIHMEDSNHFKIIELLKKEHEKYNIMV